MDELLFTVWVVNRSILCTMNKQANTVLGVNSARHKENFR